MDRFDIVSYGGSAKRERPKFLVACILCCAAMLLLQLFRWPLIDILSIFIEPIFELALYLTTLILTIVAAVQAVKQRRVRRSWLPLVLCLASWLAVLFVPFTAAYLKANFLLYRKARTETATRILNGPEGMAANKGGRGNVVELPPGESLLSSGGGEVMVDHRDGKVYILFFTFRGILDSFSGYVYSPSNTPPARDQFLGRGREVWQMAPNWFWYSS